MNVFKSFKAITLVLCDQSLAFRSCSILVARQPHTHSNLHGHGKFKFLYLVRKNIVHISYSLRKRNEDTFSAKVLINIMQSSVTVFTKTSYTGSLHCILDDLRRAVSLLLVIISIQFTKQTEVKWIVIPWQWVPNVRYPSVVGQSWLMWPDSSSLWCSLLCIIYQRRNTYINWTNHLQFTG